MRVSAGCLGGCLESVWGVSGGCLDGCQRDVWGCLRVVWELSGGGVWGLFGWYLWDVCFFVSRRCLEAM